MACKVAVDVLTLSLLTCYLHWICHSRPNLLFQMENLNLPRFPHSFPARAHRKPLWIPCFLTTFGTSFNHSVSKETRHRSWQWSHRWGKDRPSPRGSAATLKSAHLGEIQVQSHICVCYAGRAAMELRVQGVRNIWGGRLLRVPVGCEASLMEWAFKVIRNYTQAVCLLTPSGKRPWKFKRRKTT